MVLDEIKKKERREGREEGKIEGLEEGIEIGKEEGREEGIEIGKEKGIEEGKSRERSDIVIQLLQKMRDAKQVASLLDMPIEAVERIAERNSYEYKR